MGRRIGFLLANVYQGASLAMWRSIASEAKKEANSPLFVFPGGRLRYAQDNEYLRNSIYDLANSFSLDGAIIWASTLAGEVGTAEAEAFALEKSQEMPVVALGMPIKGCPSVNFDAYHGMKAEIEHLIKVHDDRKIVFVRGPESHRSAEDRLRAYKDALQENGIAYDPQLVSSPHAWSDGLSALVELIEKRGLVPGKDFSALAAASDMLLLSAVRYFERIGIAIPDQMHVAGFNDNEENMLMAVEPTTVRMPIEALASSSYSLLSSMKECGETKPDIILSADLIVRRSCGCQGVSASGGIEHAEKMIGREKAVPYFRDIISYLNGNGDDAFLCSSCDSFVSSGGDSEALLEVVSSLSGSTDNERKDRLFMKIVSDERRVRTMEKQRTRKLTSALDSFKTRLLAARSLEALPSIMQDSFRPLDIAKCFLMLYKDFSSTRFAGGFSGDRLYTASACFPRRNIVPDEMEDEIRNGTFVIEPLFFDSQELGYIVLGTEWCEGYVLEDIRTSLSSSLKGISLFDETNEAKEQAERGERDAEEFYAKVSEGLIQPLADMKTMVARKGRVDKAGLMRSITGAEHILELALAERGELGIARVFIPLSWILPELSDIAEVSSPARLPLMEIDKDRLLESFSILSSIVSRERPSIVIEEKEAGILFTISGEGGECDDTARQLASCIVLLHSGSVSRKGNTIKVSIPYPRLSDGRWDGTGLVFAGRPEDKPDGLDAEVVAPEDLPSIRPHTIALLASDRAASSALLSDRDLRHASVMLFSDKEDISLNAALESAAADDERTFLLFGSASTLPPSLWGIGRIEEAKDAESALGRKDCSLVIMTKPDAGLIREIRKRKQLSSTPVLIVSDRFDEKSIGEICDMPNVIIANTSILESPDFLSRLASIAGGSAILPPLTGIIVKKAIVYLNTHAAKAISRWQVAASANISEDYLTRVFRKEIGISPWDYLNRYRIQIASALLIGTAKPLSDIAEESGFQDQAYFCRVFKKIKGISPGQLRGR